MPILPLPQFEADLEADRKTYEALKPPKTIVIRFGSMKLVGEFPYDGSEKPGCGSKLVVRTHRGTELGEMLTSTCPNSGCSKSVSRKELLQYVENSGGKDYPFFTDGRVLRVATVEDLQTQERLEQSRHELKMEARRLVEETRIQIKIVDAEPILGGERLTIFYASEDRLDLGPIAKRFSEHFRNRIELKHVGARDEARLTADYEKCGQYCCCKNFLKVLKPVSMKSAKVQKATLDPLKISGRCGRLMCCLRYEDETYDELRKRLPHKKTRVGSPHGDGYVVDSQILTQLVRIRLDVPIDDGKTFEVAVPVEELTDPISKTPPPQPAMPEMGGMGGPGQRFDRPRSGSQSGPPMARPPRPAFPPPQPRDRAPQVGEPPEMLAEMSESPESEATEGDELDQPSASTQSPPSRPAPPQRPAREDRRPDRPPQNRSDRDRPQSDRPRDQRDPREQQPRGPQPQRGGPPRDGGRDGGGRGPGGGGGSGGRPGGGGNQQRPPQPPRPPAPKGGDDLDDIMRSLDDDFGDRPRRPGGGGNRGGGGGGRPPSDRGPRRDDRPRGQSGPPSGGPSGPRGNPAN